jgi:Arc/MetJ-type ribon-helix-helix transcriptional regulator
MASRGEPATKRITLDLKDSTLAKLDTIREGGRFGSRNAVIEEMVDEVIEVKEILARIEHETKSSNLKDQTNVWALAFNMNNAVNEVSRRLARFETRPSK